MVFLPLSSGQADSRRVRVDVHAHLWNDAYLDAVAALDGADAAEHAACEPATPPTSWPRGSS
jgi:hypothetical protein